MSGQVDSKEARSSIDDVIERYKEGVDRTLLREHLKLTVDQRFEKFLALMEFLEELKASGSSAHGKS